MNLFAILKSKLQLIACIVLTTLLAASYLSNKSDQDELIDLREKVIEHVKLNKSLSEQNLSLAKELREKPKEYITITKDVDKEVCNGAVNKALINSLPSKKGVVNEENVTHTADIDDRLPTDLIKLLK